ncbi:MAG: hypothetical protein AAGA37_15865 [Actinomycetota bacterium]
MNDQQAHVESALSAVNAALAACGELSLDQSGDFVRDDSYPLTYRLEVADAAPIRFQFYGELNVWVGPFSEVLVVDALDQDLITSAVRRLLTSSIRLVHESKRGRVTAWDEEGEWINLKTMSLGRTTGPHGESVFGPVYRNSP